MRQLDPSHHFVAAYWPNVNGVHIGLVYPKLDRILVISYVASSVLTYLFVYGVAPHYSLIPVVCAALGCIVVSYILHKSRKYYEVDEQGNPIRFYSKSPPSQIQKLPPVKKLKFLELVNNS
jgi:hypothetical protein